MNARKLLIICLAASALMASGVRANSCSNVLVIKNHHPYAVTLSIKSFYGADFERPNLFDFDRETSIRVGGRFTAVDEAAIGSYSERTLYLRTLCPQGTEKRTHYVNWRYASPGTAEKSGQLELTDVNSRIDIR